METRLANVCSRTAVRSRLNRYLCKWLSIILSRQSGEQLQRNCMSTEIICISLRANYWLSCLRGFNRRPAVGYSFFFFFFQRAFEAFFFFFFWRIGSNTPQGQSYVFIWQMSCAAKFWSVTSVIYEWQCKQKTVPLFDAFLRLLFFFQLKAQMW